MASIERTAYPRFKEHLSQKELEALYEPTSGELHFVKQRTTSDRGRLTLLVLLKCHQRLGYLPASQHVPEPVKHYLCDQFHLPHETLLGIPGRQARHRYRQAVHAYLGIRSYSQGGMNGPVLSFERPPIR